MGFDAEAFKTAKFGDRTASVPAPEMADWFGEDRPGFIVRALTGPEIARVRQELDRRRAAQKLLAEASQKGLQDAMIDAARVALGIVGDGDIPEAHARYIHIVHIGTVEPALDLQTVVKIGKEFGVLLVRMAEKILELTGRGRESKKKPVPSGEIQR